MDKSGEESIEDIAKELRTGLIQRDLAEYFKHLADRIEAAHTADVLKAMNELMEISIASG